jgi:predicted MFS family arabinose efflux permease
MNLRSLPIDAWRQQPIIGYLLRPLWFSRNARLYLTGSLLMGLGHGALMVHMNLYYRGLGLGEAAIGRILSAGSLGTVLVALPAAIWVDRFPPRLVFATAALGYGAATVTQLLTGKLLVLCLASGVTRALFTVHWVAAAPFFMRNATERERLDLFGFAHAGETLATVISAAGVGALAAPLIAATGSELHGLRTALFVPAIAAAVAAVPFLLLRDPHTPAPHRRVADYIASRHWPLIARLTLPACLVGLGAGLIIPFLNLYFRDRFSQSPRAIGGYFAIAQLLTMVGFLAGPPLARRIGAVRTVVGTELLSIPFFLLLALSRHLELALVAFWMRAALMNMNHPVSIAFSMSTVPHEEQAVTNSVRELCWNLAWMVSTQLGGILIQARGYEVPMFITMSLYAMAATLFYRFFRHTARPSRPAAPLEPELELEAEI